MTQVKKISALLSSPVVPELYKEFELSKDESDLAIRIATKQKKHLSDEPLTDDEIQLALLEARKAKAAKVNTNAYMKKLAEGPKYEILSAEELYKKAAKTFVIDETNKNVFGSLCLYFTGDARSKLDLTKGIFLYGPVGCGKTEIMKWFRHNPTNSYSMFDAIEVAAQFTKYGHDSIFRYKNLIESSDTFKTFGQTHVGVCFDDLGTEVDKKHYGNESNVFADIFLTRYRNKDLHCKTHFTTNLNTNDIEERYGLRVRSRMREMVNLLEFPDDAPDRRK